MHLSPEWVMHSHCNQEEAWSERWHDGSFAFRSCRPLVFLMSASPAFVAYISEQLAPLGGLTSGQFFGGHAFRHNGTQFALVMRNTLYFCVDGSTRPLYISAGSQPFSYNTARGPVEVRRYYSAPESLFDDSSNLLQWARQAIAAARPA